MGTIAENWAAGLRELADFAEQHPDLFKGEYGEYGEYGETINLFASDPKDMVEKTRLLGGSRKVVSESWYTMSRRFGPHRLELSITRSQFCERVQTGTKTIEKPDPEALKQVPFVEVEEAVYEWICPDSVLAHSAAVEVSS